MRSPLHRWTAFGCLSLLTLVALLIVRANIQGLFDGPSLYFGVRGAPDTGIEVFWDVGSGLNPTDTASKPVKAEYRSQLVKIRLPQEPVTALRIDPSSREGQMGLDYVRLGYFKDWCFVALGEQNLTPAYQVEMSADGGSGRLELRFPGGAYDPQLMVNGVDEIFGELAVIRRRGLLGADLVGAVLGSGTIVVLWFRVRRTCRSCTLVDVVAGAQSDAQAGRRLS